MYIPASLLLMKLVGKRLQELIAKVVDFNAAYQILDEATSQTGGAAQEAMAESLRQEQKSKRATVLGVAHRLEFNRFEDGTIRMG